MTCSRSMRLVSPGVLTRSRSFWNQRLAEQGESLPFCPVVCNTLLQLSEHGYWGSYRTCRSPIQCPLGWTSDLVPRCLRLSGQRFRAFASERRRSSGAQTLHPDYRPGKRFASWIRLHADPLHERADRASAPRRRRDAVLVHSSEGRAHPRCPSPQVQSVKVQWAQVADFTRGFVTQGVVMRFQGSRCEAP